MAEYPKGSNIHIVMFPWFAAGHMTTFLHLANRLAEKGCKTTFLLPNKAKQQLQHLNYHRHLITFHSLIVPHVEGLPLGTETASDIPIHLSHLLSIALDRTRSQVEEVIRAIKPTLVIYDFAHWIPEITKSIGIKTIYFIVVCAASIAIALVPARNVTKDRPITEAELLEPPTGYPSSNVVLRGHEVRSLLFLSLPFGEGITFYERICTAMKESDIIAIRTCNEIERNLCEYIGSQYEKQVLLTGPVLPEFSNTQLEEKWVKWLGGFGKDSVIFCAFGTQIILEKNQFQELLLGLESTGLPFVAALRPPDGTSTVEEALPEGFEERVKGRGVVTSEWVQQLLFLDHPSVGCFINHCGFGSMWESLMSDCQVVLIPNLGDQILNTRYMVEELKVAVEVERDESNWFSKESLSKAVMSVMDKGSKVGEMVKENHKKWKEIFGGRDFMSCYIDKFVQNIQDLVNN